MSLKKPQEMMDVAQENSYGDILEDVLSENFKANPSVDGDTWSDIEEASFLLGLYIFGKNLALVEEFVGTKRMGQVVWFYYGKFYKSEKYHRWSEWQKKTRTSKCTYGQRIFTGARQHELLSRLALRVPEECKNTLLKETKAFEEGKTSLKEYVFTLRDKVGLNALVEAVGIGKGKQDLIRMADKPLRSNEVAPVEAARIGKVKQDLTSMAGGPLRSNQVVPVEADGIGKGKQDLTSITEDPLRSNQVVHVEAVGIGKGKQDLIHMDEKPLRTNQVVPVEAVGIGKGKQDHTSMAKKPLSSNQVAPLEAVGIDKGKQDLTSMVKKPLRSNKVAPVRPQIPNGKAYSTLTPSEIINFLTGGYRLSKARSSDLFREAVWPRLLARGWHTEQPNNHSSAADSKHSLVYLVPGVEKFTRGELVKGTHYFDSVSDVLSKVVEDPGLLEPETGEDKGDAGKEEIGCNNEMNPVRKRVVETDQRDISASDPIAKRQKAVANSLSPHKDKSQVFMHQPAKDNGEQKVVFGESNSPQLLEWCPSSQKDDVSPPKIPDSVIDNPEVWTPKNNSGLALGPQKVLEVEGYNSLKVMEEELAVKEQQFVEKNEQLKEKIIELEGYKSLLKDKHGELAGKEQHLMENDKQLNKEADHSSHKTTLIEARQFDAPRNVDRPRAPTPHNCPKGDLTASDCLTPGPSGGAGSGGLYVAGTNGELLELSGDSITDPKFMLSLINVVGNQLVGEQRGETSSNPTSDLLKNILGLFLDGCATYQRSAAVMFETEIARSRELETSLDSVSKKQTQIDRLKAKVADLQVKINLVVEREKATASDSTRLREAMNTKREIEEQLSQARIQVAQAFSEKAQLEGKVAELSSNLQFAQSQIAALEQDNTRLLKDNQDLQNQRETLQTEKLKLLTEKGQMETEKARLNVAIEQAEKVAFARGFDWSEQVHVDPDFRGSATSGSIASRIGSRMEALPISNKLEEFFEGKFELYKSKRVLYDYIPCTPVNVD